MGILARMMVGLDHRPVTHYEVEIGIRKVPSTKSITLTTQGVLKLEVKVRIHKLSHS